jgi:hypothetical protein
MKPHSRKKGLIPLLLIFLIYASGCQTPSAQSSFSSSSATSSQEISSVTESSLEQSSIDESESSLEQSSQEDSSQEDSSEEPSSNQEPPHEHSPLPDDGDCTTPIVCSCNHDMIVGEQAHRFDNACDTSLLHEVSQALSKRCACSPTIIT